MVRKILRTFLLIILFVVGIVCVFFGIQYFLVSPTSPFDSEPLYEARTDLDNIKPTDIEVETYMVAPDKPRYMIINKISVYGARVVEVGMDGQENRLGDPANVHDVGWFNQSAKPGAPGSKQTAGLYDGHNTGAYSRGVFYRLSELASGDTIIIERGDGKRLTYEVRESSLVKLEEVDMAKMMETAVEGVEGLNIISCGGEWDRTAGTYTHRVLIRAVLASSGR